MKQNIPVVNLDDYRAGGRSRVAFVETLGRSLSTYGFLAIDNHRVDRRALAGLYASLERFFAMPIFAKQDYELPGSLTFGSKNPLPPGSAVIVHSALLHGRRAQPGGDPNKPRYFIDISCTHEQLPFWLSQLP